VAPQGAAFCGNCGAASGLPVPSAAPRWGAGHDLTRYLCAAAYLDRAYATALVDQVSGETHLSVAPAPACDIPVVLRHAHFAALRRHQRDLALAVLLLITLVFLFQGADSWLVLLALAASWGTVLGFELSTLYGSHLQSLRPDRFDPGRAPRAATGSAEQRIAQVGAYAQGNVTVYSGYSPFLGYGTRNDSWSIALDLSQPGGADGGPADFDVRRLYAHVGEQLRHLALPGLEIEERLFVDGAFLVDERRFLTDELGRPKAWLPQEKLDDLMRVPEDRARVYLAVHSTGWRGELVTSLFLRFARSESHLVVEGVQTVLCPLRDRYRVIDTLAPSPTVGAVAALVPETLVSTPFLMLAAPYRAVLGFLAEVQVRRRTKEQNKQITRLRSFDYGARLSVRQQASDDKHHRFFQKQDSTTALKVCERRALDALIAFAEAHNIDVSELRREQQIIVNNGIIATQGATVEGSSVASGEGSRALTRILNKVPLVNTD
jgi:hypothetical protein